MQETTSQAVERRLAAGMEVDEQAMLVDSIEEATGEVGGASGISEAALGAYRVMASASVSLGRHDVLYALLILSVSHTYWFTAEARHRYRYDICYNNTGRCVFMAF
jgi:proteasome component ECM29